MKRVHNLLADAVFLAVVIGLPLMWGARWDWRQIDDFLLSFWNALRLRWAWSKILLMLLGIGWASAAGLAAQARWREDGAWSPRVLGHVFSAALGSLFALSGIVLLVEHARR